MFAFLQSAILLMLSIVGNILCGVLVFFAVAYAYGNVSDAFRAMVCYFIASALVGHLLAPGD